ncbi:MAG: hypothetical protein FWB86_00420 [Treponema sp.]|nr:hypothetical protein [Treponema sp.]MCL2251315.1 hypothetical protein [Treponema sp.]
MNIKYLFLNKNSSKIKIEKLKINPIIKSTLSDYLSSDFLISFLLSIVLFILYFIDTAKDIKNIYELKNNQSIFIVITLIFSVGFTSIIGSIPNINWKFQSIVSPNSFKYHYKRTLLILCGFFGWIILLFIIFGSFINIMLTIKYLYCLLIILFTTINISLTISHMIIKLFIQTIFIIITLWISTLHIGFLPILLIPIFISFIKAKNEYREWYLI